MKYWAFFFVAWFVIIACGHCVPPDWATRYIEIYHQEAEARGCDKQADEIRYVMHEDFEKPEHIGYCHYGPRIIAVRESWWLDASDTEKEILMLHEIGHCVLGWHHVEQGIMQPVLMSERLYKKTRRQWLDDYFSICHKNIKIINIGRIH